MASHVLSLGLALSLASTALAFTPLVDNHFHYPDQIPYKVDTDPSGRGPQFGYNKCNSTTEGPNAECQTALLNSIDDFCLWGPADKNSTIADEEAKTIAFCSKPGHGARTIPAGTLTGVQVLKAPSYILFTGHLNQEGVDMQPGDYGGEMDPHGADLRGNPLGGLVYSNAFPSNNGNNETYQQVIEWHNFMGSGLFCFKICDYSVANSKPYCNNVFDRTGCAFVAPAAYQDGVFEVCESDNQDPVGVYTGSNGVVSTYSQPPEGVPISSLPSVKTPASSQCTTYSSASIYAAAATVTPSGASSSGASSATSGTSKSGSKVTTSTTTGKANPTNSGSTSPSSSGAADRRVGSTGLGMGPVVAIAASILAGFGAVLAGL